MVTFPDVPSRMTIAKFYSMKYGIDTALICAVAEVESEWNQYAVRYEPDFYTHYIEPLFNKDHLTMTEATARSTSWGLMQIMGETAREFGFVGEYLSQLCDPDIGLDYGCKKLRACLNEHSGDVREALLEYNGGSDLRYPDEVLACISKYQ